MMQASQNSFVGYHKIYEDTKHWLPSKGLLKKCSWMVTEKVHGSNLCFVLSREQANGGDQIMVEAAKRKQMLASTDQFYNFQNVLTRLEEKLRKIFELLEQEQRHVRDSTVQRVLVFGELFGGIYPEDLLPADPNVEAVQTGVYYCPSVEFYAFDIALTESMPEADEASHTYLDYERALHLFRAVGLFCAEPLAVGTYEQMMEYSIEFDSTIPGRLGMPPLPKGTNYAEGVVIKPMSTLYVETNKGKARAIVKKKISKFSEVKKYNEAEKWTQKGCSPPAQRGKCWNMRCMR